jgi:nucleoid DNA-binding protein
MTKQELIKRVAGKTGLPGKTTVGVVLDAMFAELAGYFIEARTSRGATARFTYPGFGTFTKKKRGERGGRNPQTGEPITIPATTTVAFQPGQELKAALNRELRRRRRTG